MASRDPFASALADADALLAERELGAQVDERLFASVGKSSAPSRRRWLLAALVPVVALALHLMFGAAREPRPSTAPTTIAGWTIHDATEGFEAREDGGRIVVAAGRATFEDPAWGTLANEGALTFERAPDGVRVIEGQAVFAVTHDRGWNRPKHVVVSHGVIEIVGTRFTVEQGSEGGRVTLHEGAIRFVDEAGTVSLSTGGELRWPRAARDVELDGAREPVPDEPALSLSAAPTAVPVGSSEAPDPSALMRKVEELRSRGRYDEAAELLRRYDERTSGDTATRERLSFERGSLLTYQREDKARACAHWIQHLSQYPNGRYGDDVHRALQYLKCGSKGQDP